MHVTVHVTEAVKGAHKTAKTTLLCEYVSQGFDSPTGYHDVNEKKPQILGLFCYSESVGACNVRVTASSFASRPTCVYSIV